MQISAKIYLNKFLSIFRSCINVPGRPGTTKRRQYYFKRMAKSLSHHTKNVESIREDSTSIKNEIEDKTKSYIYHLYALKMRLTCAIPDEQNTRGMNFHRKILISRVSFL